MRNLAFIDTKIGKLAIEENGRAITDVYIVNEEIEKDDSILLKETDLLKEASKQIKEYFEGNRQNFDLLLEPKGTEFQQKVWNALKEIHYGETKSYGEIAKMIGNEKAARAVGMANNKNPIMIIIPCHRVIGANGKLVGYSEGVDIKETLLNLEKDNRN
ncbi:methylated-DNA--[protein]-cysteine S-methyltransferase [Clostridium sp.]|uniref:methylated-DNA--[protein]-cysteine S-methyltransferase n=1 Tax=Clostridium sp. TaxID=1506 RepID=UPI002A9163F5|nr:methylated-DNA--[protein]-cysteine S-methyltransferase [Clostridium sp.]MDY6012359.1 methylated-DNA--[protein]-cysteine S-methyltransferase [Clostridium sp.]